MEEVKVKPTLVPHKANKLASLLMAGKSDTKSLIRSIVEEAASRGSQSSLRAANARLGNSTMNKSKSLKKSKKGKSGGSQRR